MSRTDLTEERATQIFVEQVNRLADHARTHGPAPDCAARVRAVVARHEATVRTLKGEERADIDETSPVPAE